MSHKKHTRTNKLFKLKLFSLLTLALIVLAGLSISTIYFLNQQSSLSERYYKLKVVSQDIIYYDEVLTMSALVGAHSGGLQWNKRYNQYVKLLESALIKASLLDSEITQFIKKTDAANNLLVLYEKKAFSLIEKGLRQQAIELLTSNEYQKQKELFIQGINDAVGKLLIETDTALGESNKIRDRSLLISVGVFFCIIIGLWVYLIRYVQATDKIMQGLITEDALSGLFNRRKFDEALTHDINRAYRANAIVMLAVIDIDNFKRFNDTYGHPKGDEVIRQIGRVLRKYFQRANESAYRIGGEEFCVVASYSSINTATDQINNFVKQVHKLNIPHKYNEPHNTVTVSCGVDFSTFEKNSLSEELYANADKALYKAKESGRNRLIVFNE